MSVPQDYRKKRLGGFFMGLKQTLSTELPAGKFYIIYHSRIAPFLAKIVLQSARKLPAFFIFVAYYSRSATNPRSAILIVLQSHSRINLLSFRVEFFLCSTITRVPRQELNKKSRQAWNYIQNQPTKNSQEKPDTRVRKETGIETRVWNWTQRWIHVPRCKRNLHSKWRTRVCCFME